MTHMRRSALLLPAVALALGTTSCVVDSSWLGIVGRWQDTEAPGLELEFTSGGRFNDYFFGERVSYGEFRAQGSTIQLHYLSPCGEENQIGCDVRLGFTVTDDTLIITDSQGDLIFRRVGSSP